MVCISVSLSGDDHTKGTLKLSDACTYPLNYCESVRGSQVRCVVTVNSNTTSSIALCNGISQNSDVLDRVTHLSSIYKVAAFLTDPGNVKTGKNTLYLHIKQN